eukprot:16395260-Heterocapsa_arctica.AAC.1
MHTNTVRGGRPSNLGQHFHTTRTTASCHTPPRSCAGLQPNVRGVGSIPRLVLANKRFCGVA